MLSWRGKVIVDLSRAFLDTNGAHQETNVFVEVPDEDDNYLKKTASPAVAEDVEKNDVKKAWLDTLSDLNVCSQKGLVEMFDASIGSGSVYMPYGGKTQLTETQVMAAKVPMTGVMKTDAVSLMSYGHIPCSLRYRRSWTDPAHRVSAPRCRLVPPGPSRNEPEPCMSESKLRTDSISAGPSLPQAANKRGAPHHPDS